MRKAFVLLGLMGLAACDVPPVSGTRDSGVLRLSEGMTFAQVRAVLGPQTAGDIRADGAPNCLAWVYDEAFDPKFIHATFEADTLIAARDNIAAPCPG